jgi:hypothetical protein
MARFHALVLATGLLPAIAGNVGAQGERLVRGAVTDTSGIGVPYVNIRTGREMSVSDDSGRFSMTLRDRKTTRLEFRRIGYLPVDAQLVAGGDTALSVTLIPSPRLLPAAAVQVSERIRTLERRGFYRRMAEREKGVNTGHFITAEEIEIRNFPTKVTALFEGITSVRIHTSDRGLRTPMGTGGCVMTTYLDGVRLVAYAQQRLSEPTGFYDRQKLGPPRSEPSPGNSGLDGLIHTGSVAGIEVYPRGNQAPPQFQSLNGNCGVILIWTR